MDTTTILETLHRADIPLHHARSFRGAFPYDRLPPAPIRRFPAAFIVNTDPSDEPGTHWIALFFPSHDVESEYFDSFGRECTNSRILNLLKKSNHQGRYRWNRVRLQDTFSTVCGHYCNSFIFARLSGLSMGEYVSLFPSVSLPSSHNGYELNDIFVRKLHRSFFPREEKKVNKKKL